MKHLLGTLLSAAAISLAGSALAASPGFVSVKGLRFERDGKPYAYLGANFWYGAMLGREGAAGDRARLVRELDRMKALEITNLRIVALWEGPDQEPWRILPSLQPSPGVFDEAALKGLDFLLAEMGRRGMTAVVVLNNFWPWSGGMAQYLAWSGAGAIPYPPPQPGGDWGKYQEYVTKFYSNKKAVRLAAEAADRVITRRNTVTGTLYADDAVIMAWQLANEPRGGRETEAFNKWIKSSAKRIKSLAPRQLVTTGVEGETPWPQGSGMDLVKNHSYPEVDYATAHIWAQNWGWFNAAEPTEAGFEAAVSKMAGYLETHLQKTRELGKPLVIEEFGLGRELGSHDPKAPTNLRDRYYAEVFSRVLEAARKGDGAAGVNFWAWAGEGRPAEPFGGFWQLGLPFTGDPPHESQGWYGVDAQDASTLSVISDYARKFSLLN